MFVMYTVQGLGMVKELLQQNDEIAMLGCAKRIENDPHDIERGAQHFGNVPGLARYMPPSLQEFSIELSCSQVRSLCGRECDALRLRRRRRYASKWR